MTIAEYLIGVLKKNNVTDVFGIPGGVVLDLLYTFEKTEGITPHLSYHEQAAAFEACGYSQVNHTLGVTYATRGPGFTNLITSIADAYADSIPVLFITAHTDIAVGESVRFEKEQELNTVPMIRNITKYAEVIENIDDIFKIEKAVAIALGRRKGPVFLDFASHLWNREICISQFGSYEKETIQNDSLDLVIKRIRGGLKKANRPVLLVGDGVRQANAVDDLKKLCDILRIPVISSRCGEDVGKCCENYFGYIGSHGIRYANFVFAKADYVIVLGNRMAFPAKSKSFSVALRNKTITWIDVDEKEVERIIDNTEVFQLDVRKVISALLESDINTVQVDKWISDCNYIRDKIADFDKCWTVSYLVKILNMIPDDFVITVDVGNNEFWVAQAYVLSKAKNRILYSKSFGALGSSVAKAIGAYYASGKPVICFTGDQGLQLNVQELQFISQEKLPIYICVINNSASGMIRDKELQRYKNKVIHTTKEGGYSVPNLQKLAETYRLKYEIWGDCEEFLSYSPVLLELRVQDEIPLRPLLPIGRVCQNMSPDLPANIFAELDAI
ncbi:MAG: thiamine pyrophosphate-binding protein [Coprococcus sp.]|nr:thiamine pyrophosphate-binding protein [Coprococcus sp.]